MLKIAAAILYVFTSGAMYISGTKLRVPSFERPIMYNSTIIQFIINVSFLFNLVLFFVLLIMDWKLALILLIASVFLMKLMGWLFETIVLMPFVLWATSRDKDGIQK